MDAPAPYSAYSVNCHLTGHSFWVNSEGLWHLALVVLTWPGVKAYVMSGPSWVYDSSTGDRRVAAVAATAVAANKQLVYFALASSTQEDTERLQVLRAHAERLGAQLVVVSLKELYARRTEVNNRRDAHAFLFRGRGYRTGVYEAKLALELRDGPRMLGEVSAALGLNWGQGVLLFLRGWLNGKLAWDIASQVLAPSIRLKLVSTR